MSPWPRDGALAALGRGVVPVLVSTLVFLLVYRLGQVTARGWQRRYYRRMLILYQATGPSVRMGWLVHVTLAPVVRMLTRARIGLRDGVAAVPSWAGRWVVGSEVGVSRQDLRGMRVGGIVVGAVLGLASGGNLAAGLGGVALGVVVPLLVARRRHRLYHRRFAEQLPQVLTVMITALRAGRSLAQTVDVIAEEVDQPARAEFGLVAQKQRLGVDLSEALKQLAERVKNADLHLLVNALVVQRETGGNLVPMLETIYTTVRERLTFQGEIRTMTAQVRLTARVITGLPFVLFGLLLLVNPTGFSFFWTFLPLGPALIGAALTLILIGHLVMRRLLVLG